LETQEARFTALVARQSRFVFRVAWGLLRNVQDAEDVVQETFLRLHRSGSWEQLDSERAFLATTAWRLSVDRLRRTKREVEVIETASSAPGPESAVIAADWNTTVARLVDALPDDLRQPLVLSGIQELTSPEIARIMGIPEGTVRTRIMRARQILKQKLEVRNG
jgi:RNA polymerase sigma-70 factor (ECF subfamily)